MQNHDIFRTKDIFRTMTYLECEVYSEHCPTTKMERFAKIATSALPEKKFLIFQEMEPFYSSIKKFIIFSYTPENGNLKKNLYFMKQKP